MCFARKPPEVSPVVIDSRKIEMVSSATLLGVVFLDNLKYYGRLTWTILHSRRPKDYTS